VIGTVYLYPCCIKIGTRELVSLLTMSTELSRAEEQPNSVSSLTAAVPSTSRGYEPHSSLFSKLPLGQALILSEKVDGIGWDLWAPWFERQAKMYGLWELFEGTTVEPADEKERKEYKNQLAVAVG